MGRAGPGVDVDIDLPAGWATAEPGGPVALIARPPAWRGPRVPSISVTRALTPGLGSLADYRDAQVTGACVALGGFLVHVETGHRPERHLDLTLAIELRGHDLTIVQRHLVGDDGLSVVATGLAADPDWPRLAPLLIGAVRSLRLRA